MDSEPIDHLKSASSAKCSAADAVAVLPSQEASAGIRKCMRRYQIAFAIANFAVSSN